MPLGLLSNITVCFLKYFWSLPLQLIESQPGPSGEQSEWASTQEPTQSRPPLPRSLPALRDEQGEILRPVCK